jgi:hypothetical protein
VNDTWKRLAKKYIECYEAIRTLEDVDILDEEESQVHKANLLSAIICEFRNEVEE